MPGRLDEAVRSLPKAEIHLHLEGCVPWEVARRAAARRAGGTTARAAAGDLPVTRPAISDLSQLLEHLDVVCGLISEPGDLRAIARATAERLSASGARYGDVIVNPFHWPHWRERIAEMVGELSGGFAEAAAEGEATVKLCISVNRQQPAADAEDLVAWLVAERPEGVVGISIDGDEAKGSNNERFAPAFARAAAAGLRRTAHAGESSGPEGVREALDLLGAERVDHGVRAVEDRALVGELAERGVPLDICPTSNVLLGISPSLARHPIEQLRRDGVRVSVNTDDPEVYGIDLAGEYARCAAEFGWGRRELAEVARTSVEASFASEEHKAAMRAELEGWEAGAAGPESAG